MQSPDILITHINFFQLILAISFHSNRMWFLIFSTLSKIVNFLLIILTLECTNTSNTTFLSCPQFQENESSLVRFRSGMYKPLTFSLSRMLSGFLGIVAFYPGKVRFTSLLHSHEANTREHSNAWDFRSLISCQ